MLGHCIIIDVLLSNPGFCGVSFWLTRVSLMAFYGKWYVMRVKPNTYLDSAKPEDSLYGIFFLQKRSLLKTSKFSSSFFTSRRNIFQVIFCPADEYYGSYEGKTQNVPRILAHTLIGSEKIKIIRVLLSFWTMITSISTDCWQWSDFFF